MSEAIADNGGKHFVDVWSSAATPAAATLRELQTGKDVMIIAHSHNHSSACATTSLVSSKQLALNSTSMSKESST